MQFIQSVIQSFGQMCATLEKIKVFGKNLRIYLIFGKFLNVFVNLSCLRQIFIASIGKNQFRSHWSPLNQAYVRQVWFPNHCAKVVIPREIKDLLTTLVSFTTSIRFSIFVNARKENGVPTQPSGFVCTFHAAILGLFPKRTIYAFFNLNLNCEMIKRRNKQKKRPGLAHFFKKRNKLVNKKSLSFTYLDSGPRPSQGFINFQQLYR